VLQSPSRHRIRDELARERPSSTVGGRPDPVRALARKARAAVSSPDRRAAARFRLLTRIARVLVPQYVMTAPEKAWFIDDEFFRQLYAFDSHDQAADRRYTLRQLLSLVNHVPGDTAECGVHIGTSSWFICDHFRGSDRTHHAFDSFEGLSEPSALDGSFWRAGDLRSTEDHARAALSPFDARLYPGWFPDRFDQVADRTFAFVHVDVDLYEPTRHAIEFFYPRMAPGGVILLDDHGLITCPGATRAVEEYMADRPEPIVLLTTGQAMILKIDP
jgi:O-methyltransferase